ncbi:PRC-barrel domain-containing protein [Costertonia aggregata]|uniref:PRC-barrel domain-containing protein n=1 Tax=Costertonia aggregata TaxID=343403 RepID=A0A7H9ASV5_9FLAO|nr:PRC-barrel domain-containing protein [Costertonia aggregata]QLG46520.1 PRC-barrel domain-containing protein [Costertonia aggregata]
MSTYNNKDRNLFYLHELSDYKVSDSDKDVRGWPVKDADGHYIGEVENLLISKSDERVVYLDVEVDEEIIKANHKPYAKSALDGTHGFVNEEGENHIIIPIGLVDLDLEQEIVNTPDIGRDVFSETKRIRKGSLIDRHYETDVLESYQRDEESELTPSERMDNDPQLYKSSAYQKSYTGAY